MTIFLVLFAFTTILVGTITENDVSSFSLGFALSGSTVWSLYSWSCWEDLSSWIWFGLSQIIVNALMALPNLIALLVLSPVVIAETKKYF